jgi:hypothetical protein
MSDYFEIEPGLVISEDGEIVDNANQDDSLAFIARRRHEARVQLKAYEDYIRVLDAVLLKKQHDKRVAYGDTVCTIAGGTYSKTDAAAFSDALEDLPLEAADLLDVIGAATGFKRELLGWNEKVLAAFDANTATLEKRPWLQTSIARKPAPKLTPIAAREALEAGR